MQNLQPAVQPRLVTMNVYGPFDQRNAVRFKWQQMVQRNREVIQVGDERPVRVDCDLAAATPGQTLDSR